MKSAFTLIEIVVVLLILGILIGIAINYNVFSEERSYLRNFNYRLFSDLSLAKNLSLSRQNIEGTNLFACGYGFLFTSSSYIGYAYVSSSDWLNCDYLASSSPTVYATSLPEYLLHTNGEIRNNPIPTLQAKANFNGEIKFSTSSADCSENIFDNYQKIAIVFYNPYGDYLFLGEAGATWVEFPSSSFSDIYICLSYQNDNRYLRVNKTGQLIVNVP
ncbi:MAG: prepilin-type N-terminal cleavage/methylation domain-containing protein [Patescibacteria group bacterium]|nr:prepilin-type N-terminal cleavage/methylation domain-containing protein [Patescibacteria group bacterium]